MTLRDDQFQLRMMRAVTKVAYRRAYAAIPRRFGFLRKDLEIQIASKSVARLYLDPYYALYVHDGSGPLNREGDGSVPPYVWYKNPKEDPRLSAGRTPSRAANLRHLNGEQFRRAYAARKLIVTRSIKRRKASLFFDNKVGMKGFRQEVSTIIPPAFSEHIRTSLGKDFQDRELIE